MWQKNCHRRGGASILRGVPFPPPHDVQARARAAIAYAGLEYSDIYKALNIERSTFARKIGKKGDANGELSARELDYIIERTGVGKAWFTADFNRLEEIPLKDSATRFADAAREEARRTRARRGSTRAAPRDADAEDSAQ